MIDKPNDLLKNYSEFAGLGGFGLVNELHWEGSAANGAILSSFNMIDLPKP